MTNTLTILREGIRFIGFFDPKFPVFEVKSFRLALNIAERFPNAQIRFQWRSTVVQQPSVPYKYRPLRNDARVILRDIQKTRIFIHGGE